MDLSTIANFVSEVGTPGCVLRRLTGVRGTYTDVTLLAVIRSYMPDELIGDITQGDRKVIISNAEIINAAWPGPPIRGDQLIAGAVVMTIQGVQTNDVGGVTGSHELQCRGL